MAGSAAAPRVLIAAIAIAAMAWLAAAVSVAPATRGAAYGAFYANFAGEELMRAMNADRTSLGLAPLGTDSTLEGIARDRALACPSDPNLTIRGRARDMADRGYLSHTVPGCSDSAGGTFDAFDLLKAFGYSYAAAAEDIADNNYPSGATAYATGCSLNGSGCSGSITLPETVAVAARSFMSSSAHRANLLSTTYDRFGCGSWASASGYHYFACYFSQSGNGTLDRTGPAIGHESGVGGVFAVGSTVTFTASAADAHSVLSDGWAALDGVHIRNWAWNHAGATSSLSATASSLKAGTHTFTWWVRDASTHATSATFTFSVASSGGATPKPAATPKTSPRPSPATTATPSPTGPSAPPAALASPAPTQPSTASDLLGSEAPGVTPGPAGFAIAGGSVPPGGGSSGSGRPAARPSSTASEASLLALLAVVAAGSLALLIRVGPGRLGRTLRNLLPERPDGAPRRRG